MAYLKDSKSAAVRANLPHPVIDADGHWLEPVPIFLDFLHAEGGLEMVERWRASKRVEDRWYELSPAARRHERLRRPTWWAEPADTLDRATAMAPGLMYERLDDFGVDFAIVYSTLGLVQSTLPDDEMRAAVCRAINTMNAELFAPYADRMTPVAVIPTVTPDEAMAETRFALETLGLKTIMIANHVRRPVPAQLERSKDASAAGFYIDFLALESPYDYDPFWQLCVDLKLPVTAHSSSMGWQSRSAVDNFTFNHIGHFAGASHGFAKALLFGGVLERFPGLHFGMLEGGAGWACNLLTDTIGHWQKRHAQAVQTHSRPENLDMQRLGDLLREYGGARYHNKMDDILASPSSLKPFHSAQSLTAREAPFPLDDFARANINCADDLRRLFAQRFFFGCESDDPSAAWAFHDAHRLNPMFSSDVGHFDVIDMSEVLEEAYELVEHEMISLDEFKQFTFSNAAKLHTAQNSEYFAGTVVEQAVREAVF
jgi:predicted TIM-barrel fold metal-dependent hydrolase